MPESILDQFVDWLDEENIAQVVYDEVKDCDGIVTIHRMKYVWLAVCGDLYQIIRERL